MRDQVEPLEADIHDHNSKKLSRRESLAMQVAGSLADRPFRLTDDLMSELRSEFSESEIVEMVFCCGLFSWGNIFGIGLHTDTFADSPYGSGLDYTEAERHKRENQD